MIESRNDFQQAMVDLHGCSEEQAKQQILYWLSHSCRNNINKIRFVTGRGNHVNAKGNSGTLYKNFLNWINEFDYKDRISKCEKHDGYFEVRFKPTHTETLFEKILMNEYRQFLASDITRIKKCADNGDPEYQVMYGKYLEQNQPGDFKDVYRYYHLAAMQNFAPAMHEVARCYLHGIGIRHSDQQAFSWLEKADKLGLVDSTVALGDCYWMGHGIGQDPRIALALYAKAAAKKHPVALRKIASAYHQGIVVPKDFNLAFARWKEAADLGDTKSQYNVAVMLQDGKGIEPSNHLALKYFRLGANGGDPDAQFKLGQILLSSNDEKNKQDGIEWLKKASDSGSNAASTLLTSIGNKSEKQKYAKKAAETGNFLYAALNQINDKDLTEEEVNKIFDKEIRKSYDLQITDILLLDHHTRYILLDSMLVDGKRKYKVNAFQAISMMAKDGCIFALRRLSYFFLQGFPGLQIKKDPKLAIFYLEKGHSLHDSKAMVMLGYCYEQGIGVAKSNEKALELYQEATQYKYATAYFNCATFEMRKIPNADIYLIVNYLQLAIKYENKYMAVLESGTIDAHEKISDRAQMMLNKMLQLVYHQQANNFAGNGNDGAANNNSQQIKIPQTTTMLLSRLTKLQIDKPSQLAPSQQPPLPKVTSQHETVDRIEVVEKTLQNLPGESEVNSDESRSNWSMQCKLL